MAPARLALALALLLVAPAGAAPLVFPGSPAASAPAAPPVELASMAELTELLLRLAPLGGEAQALLEGRIPFPLGPSAAEALLPQARALHTLHIPDGPDLVLSGPVLVDDDWLVERNLTFDGATVSFVGGRALAIEVVQGRRLTVRDSTFAGEAQGYLAAFGPLDVRNGSFQRVAVAANFDPSFEAPSLVEQSRFRDGAAGVVTDRPSLEVRTSSFVNLSSGVSVSNSSGFQGLGPRVHNNTFEMNRNGIEVGGGVAGRYAHNLARANFLGASCTSAGGRDAAGVLHKPRFERNNMFSNYGEAVMGLRGITVATPFGTVTIANSACEHEAPYLGPPGAARDSVFLSSDDRLANVSESIHPSSAPPLPLPLTLVATTQTWSGPLNLAGPVVVNSPATLTISNAQVQGSAYLGAKRGGVLKAQSSTLGPEVIYLLRNDADEGSGLAIGGPQAALPVTMWRCNCTLRTSSVDFGGMGVLASSGLLTDDVVWRPSIVQSHLQGPGAGVFNLVARLTITGSTVRDTLLAVTNILGTFILDGNTMQRNSLGVTSLVGTVQSQNSRYESGLIGVLSILDTITHNQDVIAQYALGHVPLLDASMSVALSNFTHNAAGLIPVLTVPALTSTNFVDNYLFSIATLPLDTGQVDIPSGAACNGCWAPPDESRWGNVTWTSALAPNGVPKPTYAGKETTAAAGQVVDLQGLREGPAVARAGGTLRVVHAELDLGGQHTMGAKGTGSGGGTTGRVVLDNATVRNGGFVALNSTGSTVTHSRFLDFPDAAISSSWTGGTYTCSLFERASYGVRFAFQRGEPLLASRILARDSDGVALGLLDAAKESVAGTVQHSGLDGARSDGLLVRNQPGSGALRDSNLLGPEGSRGARDAARQLNGMPPLAPLDVRGNWWGTPLGPGAGGTRVSGGEVEPLSDPWSAAPHAPQPCAAFAVLSAPPVSDAPVQFEDRTLDPSALGLVERRWDFGDGATLVGGGAHAAHTFPTWGTFTVTLTAASASGAEASASRQVKVLARPVVSFDTVPAAPVEGQAVQFVDTSVDPDGGTIVQRAWACSDGFASTAASPTHKFAEGGSPSCTLTVKDDDGLAAQGARTLLVAHAPPAPAFGAAGAGGLAMQFTDLSTHPNPSDAPPAGWSWLWDFGDPSSDQPTSTQRHPLHTFTAEAAYHVCLTVTDNDALAATLCKEVDLANAAPVVDFEWSPAIPVAQAKTTFHDRSSDPDGSVAAWAWDFDGDGLADAHGPQVQHTFPAGGDYPVTLTATDDRGAQASRTRTVHVCEPPLTLGLDGGLHLEVCTNIAV